VGRDRGEPCVASLLRESNASRAPSQRTREGRPSPSHIIILHFLQSSPTTSSENGVQEHSNAGPGSRLRRHRPSLECALRRLQREQGPSSHVFMTERDGPMTPKVFHALFGRIGARAKMQFPTSAHAAAWLRLRPGERRPRHTGATGLARPQEHSAHGALHRACAGSI